MQENTFLYLCSEITSLICHKQWIIFINVKQPHKEYLSSTVAFSGGILCTLFMMVDVSSHLVSNSTILVPSTF